MIIAGAGGHAIEISGILKENNFQGKVYFFDDVKAGEGNNLPGRDNLLTSIDELIQIFLEEPEFIIGVGKPAIRKLLHDKFVQAGGRLQSVVSCNAHIGKQQVELGEGLNIMTGAVITARSIIGKGSLIHVHCSVHHDTIIGEFCELSPGCRILGNVHIGSFTSIGAGAVILPGVHVGEHAIIGAGAVVTKNVGGGTTVVGVPAHVRTKS